MPRIALLVLLGALALGASLVAACSSPAEPTGVPLSWDQGSWDGASWQ